MPKQLTKTKTRGPRNASIMIVGEAPGKSEAEEGVPFVGASGQEFKRILADGGVKMDDCFITNVCKYPPREKYVAKKKPDDIGKFFYNKTEAKKLKREAVGGLFPNDLILEGLQELASDIEEVNPDIIIAAGNTPLWALHRRNGDTGKANVPIGITKWRGSQLYTTGFKHPYKFVPIIHPASIMRNWSDRFWTVHDIQERVVREWKAPEFSFIIRPSFHETISKLTHFIKLCDCITTPLAVDLETRSGHIACIGIGWAITSAICIPFMCVERPSGYWSLAEETEIIKLLRKLFTHPNAYIIGQNYAYDRQYIAKFWGILSNLNFDTMVAQHVLWPGAPKGLDFLSSLYCRHHVYWKDESKDWGKEEEDTLWVYNCKDCSATFEAHLELKVALFDHKMVDVYKFQLNDLETPVMKTVLRGINFDLKLRDEMGAELIRLINERALWFEKIVGFNVESKSKKPWYNSAQQTMSLFYDVMNIQPVFNRKKGLTVKTADDKALTTIGKRDALAQPITDKLKEYRSLCQFYGNYIKAKIDPDGRIRCQLKTTGTETFRFASSADAFGYGTNLQNIPIGNE